MFTIFLSDSAFASIDKIEQETKSVFGNIANNKFTYHEPTYFIFGKNDLKLQFSGKYRLAKTFDLYFGYTQTMFWSIYTTSQTFTDINYNPEIFYRLVDNKFKFLQSLDFGFMHSSNGKDGPASRSVNRIYARANLATKQGRHSIIGDFKFYNIVSHEENNADIRKYLGYWDFTVAFTHLIVHNGERLDFEIRTFAGDKILNINRGGKSFGFIYHLESERFNPQFYVQYYTGYAENLLNYNKTSDQFRAGLLLSY